LFLAGGTIGLFTGISLLSLIEIGYWICRIVAVAFQPVATVGS
jgi:hypothetical protein